jgi:DNA repair exonuclease SbcCD nuclease subunit
MSQNLLYSDLHMRTDRLGDQGIILKAIGTAAVEHGVVKSGGRVINCGDLFNEKGFMRTSVWDVLVFHRLKWKEAGICHDDVIGNHDMEDREGVIHPLKIFRQWDGWNVIDQPFFIPEKNRWMFPYMHNLPQFLETIEKKKRKKQVVFCHVGIQGAWRNDKSKDTDGVPIEHFAGFRQVFTGHYHFRHAVQNVQYIGSPMQHTFAEMGQAKGYLIWDDVTDEITFFEIEGTPKHLEAEVTWVGDKMAVHKPEGLTERDYVVVSIRGPSAKVKLVTREMLQDRMQCHNIKIDRLIDDETHSRLNIKHDEALDTVALVKKYVGFVNPALDHKRLLKVGKELLA